MTKATIHQRLRDEHQVEGSLTSLKRYIALVLPEDAVRSKVTVLREDPEPGTQAQIDYGLPGSWLNPASGRSQRVWAFVMVLSHSRHMFVHPVLSMEQASWTASHVEAFAFFGGVPARLVPDNLRTGVERPGLYDPKINRSYAELATHYRTLTDPARHLHQTPDRPRESRRTHTRRLRPAPIHRATGRRPLRTRLPARRRRRLADHHREPGTPGLVRPVPQPLVAESLLDRLINTSHQVFMNGPSYRPNKRPKAKAPAT